MYTGEQSICPGCFRHMGESNTCRFCGYQKNSEQRNSYALPHFYTLADRYLLGRQLGSGGFGITYKALDVSKNELCTIKEFLPVGVAIREKGSSRVYTPYQEQKMFFRQGLNRFAEEVELLERLRDIPGVAHITDFFDENGTSYYVMEYIDGINLKRFCDRSGGRLELHQAYEIMEQAGQTLDRIHTEGKLYHGDISPENIMMTVHGQPKIIDFGSARDFRYTDEQEINIAVKPGFAPPEEYTVEEEKGPYTDVYAFAATFYYILTGTKLPDAEKRLNGEPYKPLYEYDDSFPRSLSDYLDCALELDYTKRIQTIHTFLDGIKNRIPPTNKHPDIRGVLRVIAGDKKGKQFIFSLEQTIKIGRSEHSANIVVSDDTRISKKHLELFYLWDAECFVVVDSSINGTFIKGKRLQKAIPYQIKIGEILVFGDGICKLQIGVVKDNGSYRV